MQLSLDQMSPTKPAFPYADSHSEDRKSTKSRLTQSKAKARVSPYPQVMDRAKSRKETRAAFNCWKEFQITNSQKCDFLVCVQQFSAFNPERSESDQDSQWGGSPLTDSASPQLLDPSDAAEASCAYRLYPDSGPLCYGLGLSEEDLAHAQTHPHTTTCDRVRCQSGRYFLGAPQSGREMWWDTTRSVLSLPKFSVENSEGYEITSYHGAIHGEVLGSRPQPSVSENSSGLASPGSCFPNVIMGHAKLFTPSLASVPIATICSKIACNRKPSYFTFHILKH